MNSKQVAFILVSLLFLISFNLTNCARKVGVEEEKEKKEQKKTPEAEELDITGTWQGALESANAGKEVKFELQKSDVDSETKISFELAGPDKDNKVLIKKISVTEKDTTLGETTKEIVATVNDQKKLSFVVEEDCLFVQAEINLEVKSKDAIEGALVLTLKLTEVLFPFPTQIQLDLISKLDSVNLGGCIKPDQDTVLVPQPNCDASDTEIGVVFGTLEVTGIEIPVAVSINNNSSNVLAEIAYGPYVNSISLGITIEDETFEILVSKDGETTTYKILKSSNE